MVPDTDNVLDIVLRYGIFLNNDLIVKNSLCFLVMTIFQREKLFRNYSLMYFLIEKKLFIVF